MAVDAHCHLDGIIPSSSVFPVPTGFSDKENHRVVNFAKEKGLPYVIGIAPQIAMKECKEEWIGFVEKEAKYAVGEVGLDYHWAKEEGERKKQRECFERMVEIAERKRLPLVLHTREKEAIEDVVEILTERNFPHAIVFHFYSGTADLAERALKGLEAYFSIPPLPSKNRKKTILRVGLERLVVETDSPYIVRTIEGVERSIRYVAEVLGKDGLEVEVETSLNAAKVFNISKDKVLSYRIFR